MLAQVRGTIFNEFHDEEKIIKSINFQEFEELFKLGNKLNHSSNVNEANRRQEAQLKQLAPGANQANSDQQQSHQQAATAGGLVTPGGAGQKDDSAAKRFKQPEKISFLEHNRLRNMAISLRKVSLPTEILVSSVNRLDIDQLSLDSIEILMRMVPTAQEIKDYREFEAQGKSIDCLTEEDKFLCQVSKIDRFEQKIKIMFYMKNLEVTPSSNSLSSSYSLASSTTTDSGDLLGSVKTKLEVIESAAKSLRTSDGIRILLEYILVFGNYLNSSSRSLASAPAYGYKLQALDMVTEAKSSQDKSRNLLHFIVDTILKNLTTKEKAKLSPIDAATAAAGGAPPGDGQQKQPAADKSSSRLIGGRKRISPLGAFDTDSVKMPYEFDSLIVELEQAANASLETLISEVKEFERGIELCIKELHVRCAAADALEKTAPSSTGGGHDLDRSQSPHPNNQTIVDEAIQRLQRFIKSRSCDVIELKDIAQRAQREFNECAQYFGENPRTIESSSLFSIFARHLKNFRQCQLDNKMIEKRKFDEELRKQIQLQQSLRLKKTRTAVAATNQNQENGNNKLTATVASQGSPASSPDLKDNRVLQQDEVSHGTLDILITGLKIEPYRRADGLRKSMRRMERRANGAS